MATVDRHAEQAIPASVRDLVENRVAEWNGETMSISRSWVDDEVGDLDPPHRDLARFGLLVALSPSQVDDAVVQPVLGDGNQERLVRSLAWAAMTGARRVATGIAEANPDMVANTPDVIRTEVS